MTRSSAPTTCILVAALLAGGASAQVWAANWDVDSDGVLAPGEFSTGFFGQAFSLVDADGDRRITRPEYDRVLGNTAYPYNPRWDMDVDGGLDPQEFASGFFDTYDTNGSGVLEADEVAVIEADMSVGGAFEL
jgi:hypothetical protein